MICSKDLLVEGVQYMVERAFVKDEPVYEFAMCLDCQRDVLNELSQESLLRVEAHMDERVDLVQRRKRLLQEVGEDVSRWIDRCILTKKRRSDCRSWIIYAHCAGADLLFSYWPYMISDEGMQALERLLSKKTKDTLEGFIDEYLGMPPELKDLPIVLF